MNWSEYFRIWLGFLSLIWLEKEKIISEREFTKYPGLFSISEEKEQMTVWGDDMQEQLKYSLVIQSYRNPLLSQTKKLSGGV